MLSPGALANIGQFLTPAAYVNGRWVDAAEQDAIVVHNPATGQPIGHVPNLDDRAIETAIAAADEAFAPWRALLPAERADYLTNWRRLIDESRSALARIMTAEQGKPLKEAESEIDYGANFVTWFASEGARLYGETIPGHIRNSKLMVSREPVGPALAITPWNFPSAMILRKAAAALAIGCPVIVLPSPETPFSALALARLSETCGFPPGVFQVVTGDPVRIAARLLEDTRIRAVSFTGSTPVGRQIAAQAASTVKRVSLELGGQAPFIVLDDADVDTAVSLGIEGKYVTSGQDCLAVNRFFVASSLYDRFCDKFAAAASELKVGNGDNPGTDIGPLISSRAVKKCLEIVSDARDKGARILTGGERHPAGSNFIAPSVIADVTDDMMISSEEIFGPVAAITRVEDEASAIKCASASEYGLAAYVVGRDLNRVLKVVDKLDYGMVAVNTTKFTGPPIPFGGFRQSGIGREGGRHGIEAFSELKYVCIGVA